MTNAELYDKFKKDLSGYVLKVVIGAVIFFYILSWVAPYDSTDNGWDRSGLALRIDNATGCHYLESGHGGLTPRLDKEGNHICTGEE